MPRVVVERTALRTGTLYVSRHTRAKNHGQCARVRVNETGRRACVRVRVRVRVCPCLCLCPCVRVRLRERASPERSPGTWAKGRARVGLTIRVRKVVVDLVKPANGRQALGGRHTLGERRDGQEQRVVEVPNKVQRAQLRHQQSVRPHRAASDQQPHCAAQQHCPAWLLQSDSKRLVAAAKRQQAPQASGHFLLTAATNFQTGQTYLNGRSATFARV